MKCSNSTHNSHCLKTFPCLCCDKRQFDLKTLQCAAYSCSSHISDIQWTPANVTISNRRHCFNVAFQRGGGRGGGRNSRYRTQGAGEEAMRRWMFWDDLEATEAVEADTEDRSSQ